MNAPPETYETRNVTFSVEIDGRLIVIEHVPARVCLETGEQLFSPATAERIEAIIHGGVEPKRYVQTPVFEFAA